METSITKNDDQQFNRVSELIEQARNHVAKTINSTITYTYYNIGRYIIEDEQQSTRAEYGKAVLKNLSRLLTDRYGGGWSLTKLKQIRKFYLTYSKRSTTGGPIQNATSSSVPYPKRSTTGGPFDTPMFQLSWTHYLILMTVDNESARSFYEIECLKQNWGKRQLQRQVASSLYERLALSRDKEGIMRLATEGQTLERPEDVLKNPLSLEFLGVKPDASYSESKLEHAIIAKMRDFLLELGKGFLFEAEQKRFTFDEDNYFVDLVFYNRLLRCYCLIDLKVDKLSHQDLGQMQMYVNYYDRFVKLPDEKPTIGILLCPKKNDAMVELTLPKDANIYATEYSLYLPEKAVLQLKLQEWINEFENNQEEQQ